MTLPDLLEVLNLEQLEDRLFRGVSHATPWGRVFGGQVLAQALLASALTVPDDRQVHSMHGYFILGGDITKPIVYDVDKIREGRSFTTRRCVAIQKGEAIFNSASSYHVKDEGIEHQLEKPDVPDPEDLKTSIQLAERYKDIAPALHQRLSRQLPIEVRPVDDFNLLQPENYPPQYRVWVRVAGDMPDDPRIHQAVLAYASDYHLLTTAIVPHLKELSFPKLMMTSLDHAMWFHEDDIRVDEWLLFSIDSPRAGSSRGFTRASIFDRKGRLVCSVAQEGLVRQMR
ncbi:MAG: acyl-CoA thioesterase II [Saprospiraceae bacterium]